MLGKAIQARRNEVRLGQEDLAHRVGVSQQTISRWEGGRGVPSPRRLTQLAEALEMDRTHLLRLAGYHASEQRSGSDTPFKALCDRVGELSESELVLLIDRAWQEYRERRGFAMDNVAARKNHQARI